MAGFIVLVWLTVIYVPLMLFGLIGNTLTLLVVWLRPNMRSSAHLYLSSMAVSDLLFLLLLPLDLIEFWKGWKLGVFICKLSTFLSHCCIFCTMLHITFLSMERYLVVCWPITSKTLVTRRRTRALIGCLWLGAALSAAPFLVMMQVKIEKEVDDMKREVEKEECRVSQSSYSSGLVLAMIIIYYLYFLVPLCILGLVFILIGRTLRLRTQISRKDKSQQHAVKMLGVIVLAFVLCWLPYIVRLTMFYGPLRASSNSTHNNTPIGSTHNTTHTDSTHNNTYTDSTHNNTHTDSTHNNKLLDASFYFFLVAWILSRLSAAINPLVYNLMSARYRYAVCSLVQTHCLTSSHWLSTAGSETTISTN